MVIVRDNFLPENLFFWLNNLAKNKCSQSLQAATKKSTKISKFYTESKTGWDYSLSNLQGDLVRPQYALGSHYKDIHTLILNEITKNNLIPLELDCAFFMFATTGYEIPKHFDVRYVGSKADQLKKIVKAFIFCHTEWDDSWGGELCFTSGNNSPSPNRLLIYTADEMHWVNKVNDIKENKRMIFGLRFGDELNYE